MGNQVTYFTVKDEALKKTIWPQHEVIQKGPDDSR